MMLADPPRRRRGVRTSRIEAGVVPWHAAMAATYAHATAPLRRLADRYVVLAALAVVNGRAGPRRRAGGVRRTPRGDGPRRHAGNRLEPSVVDLVEAVVLQGRRGGRSRRSSPTSTTVGRGIQLARAGGRGPRETRAAWNPVSASGSARRGVTGGTAGRLRTGRLITSGRARSGRGRCARSGRSSDSTYSSPSGPPVDGGTVEDEAERQRSAAGSRRSRGARRRRPLQ